MIKKRVVILYLVVFSVTCTCYYPWEGNLGTSNDMKDSKRRKVFVTEYTVPENPYVINDSIKLNTTEIWLEKCWRYAKDSKKSIPTKGYYLRINLAEANIEDMGFNWTIGLTGEKYLRKSGKTGLVGDFEEIPSSDTISFYVQKGRRLKDDSVKREIIGELVLVKKTNRED